MTPNKISGLQAFARYMVDAALDGGDVDGGTIQEIAHQYGLLTKREMKGPCREPEEGYCACAFVSGFPVECYRVTDVLLAKSAPAEPVSREAVEVVGVRISTDGFGSYIADSAMGIGGPAPGEVRESLMTVNQHNRIVAALTPPSPDAELVELLREAKSALDPFHREVCELQARIDAKLASLK